MISIVIPVYNGARYIEGLFENLVRQKISRQAFELVFVDDGSSDESLKLLNSLSGNEKLSVSVHSQANSGVSAARNAGMLSANGDFITFIDVDDFVTDDYFSTLEMAVEENDFDVFVFNSLQKNENADMNTKFSDLQVSSIAKSDMLHKMCVNPTAYGVVNLLLKKEFVSGCGLQFQIGYKYYEDYDFIYRAFGQADRIIVTEKILYFYVQRESSAMHKFVGERLECFLLLRKLCDWFEIAVPEFYSEFSVWGVNRIYWSVLWQAALAFNYRDFKHFAESTNYKKHLKSLSDFPGSKVKLSSKLCLCSKLFYYIAVLIAGRSHRLSDKANIADFGKAIKEFNNLSV